MLEIKDQYIFIRSTFNFVFDISGIYYLIKLVVKNKSHSLQTTFSIITFRLVSAKTMMFDPPDYPYKELSETYDPDDLLFANDGVTNETLSNVHKSPSDVTTILNTVDNQLSFHSNDSGRFFNVENTNFFQENNTNMHPNTELYIVQSDNLFNYEPTLLDENTVNQFLLPLQNSSGKSKVVIYFYFYVILNLLFICR